MKRFALALVALLISSSVAFADSSSGPGNAGIISVTGDCTGSGGSSIAVSCPSKNYYLATDPAIGFVGDGVTDNSAACNAAFGSGGPLAAGGTLYVPTGTYVLKGCVLPNGRLTVRCANRDSVIFSLPNAAGTYMFASYAYVNNTSTARQVQFDTCNFAGNDTNQSVANDLLILTGGNNNIVNSNFFNTLGHHIRLTSVDANGSTCNIITNSRIINNRFNMGSKGAIVIRDNPCNVAADWSILDNNFSSNAALCAGAEDYQIYAEQTAGALIARNRIFGQTGCGSLNLQGVGGLTTVANNFFDTSNDTSNGATNIVDVIIDNNTCTTTPTCFSSYTVIGNIWKWGLSNTLPGSTTGLTFLQAYQDSTTQTAMVANNHFYSTGTLAGIVPILFSGTQVATNHLRAYANVYSTNVVVPTDPNIDIGTPFSWLTGKPTTIAGYGLTDALKTTNNLSDITSASSARTNLGLAAVAASGSASDLGSGTLASARGGAGAISGALKGSGLGVVSQAQCQDLSNAVASCYTNTTVADNVNSGTLPAAQLPYVATSAKGAVDKIDCGTGYLQKLAAGGTWTCYNLNPIILGQGVGSSAGADTTEDTLATITVPANSIGTNGCLRVETLWTYTGSTNVKTMKVHYSTVSGTAYLSQVTSSATQIAGALTVKICNAGATNSQIGGITAGNYNVTSTVALQTGAVDTTASTTVVITGQKASSGETLTLSQYTVRVEPF